MENVVGTFVGSTVGTPEGRLASPFVTGASEGAWVFPTITGTVNGALTGSTKGSFVTCTAFVGEGVGSLVGSTVFTEEAGRCGLVEGASKGVGDDVLMTGPGRRGIDGASEGVSV